MTTRKGKIARLPLEIREAVNRCLQDGECGPSLAAWLNASPAVQAVLKAEFGGRAINVQNLSQWRRGGYREWLLEQRAQRVAAQLGLEMLGEQPAEHHGLSETMALWLMAHFAVAAERVRKARSRAEHWRLLHEMCVDVSRLRSGDHRARRLELAWVEARQRERRRVAKGRDGASSSPSSAAPVAARVGGNGVPSVNQTKCDQIKG